MNKEEFTNLIDTLGRHGGTQYNPIQHWNAKRKLIAHGKKGIEDLLAILKLDDQEKLMDVIEILGEIGDPKAISDIKEAGKRQGLWGKTSLNVGIALIKLGNEDGVEYLKAKIKDTNTHRDLRIDSAKALIKLKKRNVFDKAETVDTSGDSMTEEWSSKLEKLVNELMDCA